MFEKKYKLFLFTEVVANWQREKERERKRERESVRNYWHHVDIYLEPFFLVLLSQMTLIKSSFLTLGSPTQLKPKTADCLLSQLTPDSDWSLRSKTSVLIYIYIYIYIFLTPIHFFLRDSRGIPAIYCLPKDTSAYPVCWNLLCPVKIQNVTQKRVKISNN